ncbi:MAG: methylated-DNA--[protein]-cysteine S-methyltransferase [Anaerolineae bacterium]
MNLAWNCVDSPLGRLLTAGTSNGLSFVALDDHDAALLAALQAEYPTATLSPATDTLEAWSQTLVAFLTGAVQDIALPLDIPGTPFQWRVWRALQAIPYGATSSYGEIASALQMKNGARAVGHACATNPVSLVIPCHRAQRSDGGLGGFRWGLWRKERLLGLEIGDRRLETGDRRFVEIGEIRGRERRLENGDWRFVEIGEIRGRERRPVIGDRRLKTGDLKLQFTQLPFSTNLVSIL